MVDQTNPRTLYRSGDATVISIPAEFRREHGIELGDRFVLEATESGFRATKVEYRAVNDA